MKFKALFDSDISADCIKEISGLLLEEGFEIHGPSVPKQNLLPEAVKGDYNIVFIGCVPCKHCNDILIPTIKSIKTLDPRTEIICIGARENDAVTVEAIKSGATACLGCPLDLTLFRETIAKIKEITNTRKETYQIEKTLYEKYIFYDMISKNPALHEIFSLIRRVAPYYGTMLITGETGTGKEILAKAIHQLSPYSKEPFVVCNCSGLVETLIESELFGHVRGAFTGAVYDKKGLFEAAGNGTIFLDEIGATPLSFQTHFLRVLQDSEFRRVGSTQSMKAKCRIIAATNVDLFENIKKGLFREDLYFRLAVITIKLPPLRDRKEDIPLLCRLFLNKLNKKLGKEVLGITIPAKKMLLSYDWPGNVRELENVIERAILITTANFIRQEDLPQYLQHIKTDSNTNLKLDTVEKEHIQKLLMTTGSNRTKTASLLGISRRALLRKINKYGLM
jgi:transcriptional regulator with PAS, ATPase and Fis domain